MGKTQEQVAVEPAPWLKRANRPGSEFARRVLESTQSPPSAVRLLNPPDTGMTAPEAGGASGAAEEPAIRHEPSRAHVNWQPYAGAQALASILDELEPAARNSILAEMAGAEAPAAIPARDRFQSFGDLATLDPAVLRLLARRMDWRTTAVALKGALPLLADRFAGALASSDAAHLRAELRSLGPVRLREVQAAQQRILSELRSLTGKER